MAQSETKPITDNDTVIATITNDIALLRKDLKDKTIDARTAKKLSDTVSDYSARFDPRSMVLGLMYRSPLIVYAKQLIKSLRENAEEEARIRKEISAKEKQLKDQEQKLKDANKKKEATAQAEKAKTETKPKVVVAKDETAVIKAKSALVLRDNDVKDLFMAGEQAKQTAILTSIASSQKKTVEIAKKNNIAKEQQKRRAQLLRDRAAAQPRDSLGRFMPMDKTNSLLDKLIKLMGINTLMNFGSNAVGGFFKGGILKNIMTAVGSIFSLKMLKKLINPKAILEGLMVGVRAIGGAFLRIGGLLLRLSTIGFAIAAGLVGVFKAVDAWINTDGTLKEKLMASTKAFFIGVGETLYATSEAIFGKENTDKWLNAYGKSVDTAIEAFQKTWQFAKDIYNDPKKREEVWNDIKSNASKFGQWIKDSFTGMFQTIGNYLASLEVKIPFTDTVWKPFGKLASETPAAPMPISTSPATSTPQPVKPTELPREVFTTTSPQRVQQTAQQSLQKSRDLNRYSQENKALISAPAATDVAPTTATVNTVSTSVNNGAAIGFMSNVRDGDSTINRFLR